jgi:hypothetical protein
LAGSSRYVILFLTVAFVCAFAFIHGRGCTAHLPTHLYISRASLISYDSRRFTLNARRETAYMPSQTSALCAPALQRHTTWDARAQGKRAPMHTRSESTYSHACCGVSCVTSDATACTLWRFEHVLAATAHQALPRFFLLPCFSFVFAWSPSSRGVVVLIADWCDGVILANDVICR